MRTLFIALFLFIAKASLLLSWTAPVSISQSGDNLSPSVSTSLSGNAAAIWISASGSDMFIQASTFNGTFWSAPQVISGDGMNVSPVIRMSGIEDAIAVWLHLQNGTSSIQTARFSPGIGWSAVETLSTSNRNNIPVLSVNFNGDAIVGWVNLVQDTVEVATYISEGTWSAPLTISDSGNSKKDVDVIIDDGGFSVAVWQTWDTGEIFSTHTDDDNVTWLAPIILSNGNTNIFPKISLCDAGQALVTWQNSNTLDTVAAAFSQDVWGAPQIVSTTPTLDNDLESFDEEGFLSWFNLITNQVEATNYFSGVWTLPVTLSSSFDNYSPSLSADDLGNGFVSWSATSTSAIEVIQFPSGGIPITPAQVVSDGGINLNSNISSSGATTTVIWQNFVGQECVIQVSMNDTTNS